MSHITAEHINTRLTQFRVEAEFKTLFSVVVSFMLKTVVTYEYPIGAKESIDTENSKDQLVQNTLIQTNSLTFCKELQSKLRRMSRTQLLELAVQLGWVASYEVADKQMGEWYETYRTHRLYFSMKRVLVEPCIEICEELFLLSSGT